MDAGPAGRERAEGAGRKGSPPLTFFWASEVEWREAHDCLAKLFRQYGPELAPVGSAAAEARRRLEILFGVFDRFSARVCPDCRAVCCLVARVHYDLRDLILLHALGLEPPPHQIREREDQACRYLGESGCRLERIRRPFICTWYYCAPMLELFHALPTRQQHRLTGLMKEAQEYLLEMEETFIRVTTG